MKDGLDRTGWKSRAKSACIGMWPWMHFLDLQQLDRWLKAGGVLEVKDGLDRTGWKSRAKSACIGMWPRMHFLDLQQLDRWLKAGLEGGVSLSFLVFY